MFNRILFATTGSPNCDNAAKVAFDLGRKYKAELIVFHVIGIPTRGFSHYVYDTRTEQKESLDPNYVDSVKEELRQTYEAQIPMVDSVQIEATAGLPHAEILRWARKADVDMIVMGSHTAADEEGRAPYKAMVGNTMQKVAKLARCPVLIISRPCDTCWGYFSNIVVGVDFSKASKSAFGFASKLAKEIGSKLHVFHAIDVSAATDLVWGQNEVEKLVEQAKGRIKFEYVAQIADYDVIEVAAWEGIPYVEILKYVRENHGDLIVMAHHTREREMEQDPNLGSTVEQVVLRAACPVVSVNKPDKVDFL